MIDIEDNYRKFKKYLCAYIKRDGLEQFIKWLDTTDFKIAPASTKYHLSEKGGLCQHSLNVLMRLINTLYNEYPQKLVGNNDDGTEIWEDTCPYPKESIALVALLHDIGKANFYKIQTKNVKNEETGEWQKVPFFSVRDERDRLMYGKHEDNGLYILRQFFKLTYEEELAIKYHMGDTNSDEPFASTMTYGAYKISPLALFLHLSDMLAICMDEKEVVEEKEVDKEEPPKEEREDEQNNESADRTANAEVPF